MITDKDKRTIDNLLSYEHLSIASKLNFFPEFSDKINENLLYDAIGLLDRLSYIDNQKAKQIVVVISSILWTYKEENWNGLKDFLIKVLSRSGFSPSSIMLDPYYDIEHDQYSSLNSLIDGYFITRKQKEYEIFIANNKFLLTEFQKKVWDKLAKEKLVGISAPTSAGKSYIILLKGIDIILKTKGNIVYIVPTLTLVSQVLKDFSYQLKRFELSNYRVITTYNSQDNENNRIYILTQEKAIAAFSQHEKPFKNVRMIVIDEIQNLERVAEESDQRAKTLYDSLIEFRHSCNPDIIILSGARINGLKELGKNIFNISQADEEKTKDSPVASFTYTISKNKGRYYFKQYSTIIKQPLSIQINNKDLISGYGNKKYSADFIYYLHALLTNLGPESRNLIFSPTTLQARKTAIGLSNLSTYESANPKVSALISYIRETVHENYDMCETIAKGFVYHHIGVPSHVRSVIERAIKDRLINNVICTTTLMQGVNLPAQNVILRNPDLAINSRNGEKPALTYYEIANLRGRAGRLLKDFIGRTFVLDETSFENDSDEELFPETEKSIKSGYGETYNTFRDQIDDALDDNSRPSDNNRSYSFLLTYIRQTLLKYDKQAIERLKSVGIRIDENKAKTINVSLSKLSVPKNICFQNRYWDPFDLEILYKNSDEYNVPTSVINIDNMLSGLLEEMKDQFPIYYERFFNVDMRLIKSLSITTKEWMNEVPLKKILDSPYFNNSENIEKRISLLQNKISYGLPMLLKPLYDIKDPQSTFLHSIEMGAYMPETRKMIELNIPRETAIYIKNHYHRISNKNIQIDDEYIFNLLKTIYPELDYWRQIQLEGII